MLRSGAATLFYFWACFWRAAGDVCLSIGRWCADIDTWLGTSMTWRQIRTSTWGEDE